MLEVQPQVLLRVLALLRVHDLQFGAAPEGKIGPGLRADADPVATIRDREGGSRSSLPPGKPEFPNRHDRRRVGLQERLTPSEDNQLADLLPCPPERVDMCGEFRGIRELAAILAVRADEVRVAETAHGAGPVGFRA